MGKYASTKRGQLMKKMVKCPECGREMALVGLRWHRVTKHNVWPNKANVVPGVSTPTPVNTQTSVNSKATISVQKMAEKPKETKVVMEQETNEQRLQYCPECRRREYKIVDLEHELSQAQKSNGLLQDQINTNNNRPMEIPDLNTVIQHCESGECYSHKKQWDELKSRIVQNAYDNLPPEVIPDKVVESEGLRRGFIPKKIIIPGRFVRND
jgi:ssDNA-binding Zn-finger/Zn-ribbon topoisomerase 1